ncbi:MAG: toprim domain-containing protein [Thiohalocapsa sp.]
MTESGIDALSYAALHPDAQARYASIGGAMNPTQPALIRAALAKMPPGATLILAMDNDQAGHDLAAGLEALACEARPDALTISRHSPEGEGMDWNDVLRATPKAHTDQPAPGP